MLEEAIYVAAATASVRRQKSTLATPNSKQQTSNIKHQTSNIKP
jgi:hypothetical protein